MTSTPQRVLFLCNAGPSVGGGHVMRCLTLAGALKQRGASCAFVASPEVSPFLAAFAGPEIERLRGTGEEAETLTRDGLLAIADWDASWVVVDHYGLAAGQEARLRGLAGRLLAMDDLKRPHDADLVLDSNLGRSGEDYPGAVVLAGPDYTLIRPAFRDLRDVSLMRRASQPDVSRVLVAMGLTDVDGITARVLEAIQPVLGERQVDVVLGGSAAGLDRVLKLAEADRRLEVHVDTRAMSALTAAADLAVGAGGSSTWERCCLGLPSITAILAENQRANAQAMEAAGATVALDAADPLFDSRLASVFKALCSDAKRLTELSFHAALLCDGTGAEKVAAKMLGGR
ncbi:UDP-2,4-diacetamido-2,4,6-trideoxy-beta-L-altropyranose hydrolase [Phenylobacterium montanum]|uniref:UDP-2,4-diacetamido-2,4, 6-trideoxy-beta-L-altropyranose hydrolase n=1 Tax=Phenylobacterium montanum TaxID=2823693 RepID=A0A975G2I0_9CAUL|nr:UDP-2,4-diacetamido-2,4,6-trideoxy-beta-L-altropyranose hydrolase [Caulobacter sp. S6]QUD89938.1 UDP-2,4-diacetamido-2,4,6-trideoxy-beta-L-altropyranose hydrolase [Caulobacter sp. S6]